VSPGTALVVVQSGGQRTRPYSVAVREVMPGVAAFPSDSYSSSPAAITVPAAPVRAGDVVTFFGIGFGAVTPDVPAGRIARGATAVTGTVDVTFDGMPAKVLYAGLSPGSVGLYQFNVVVPDSAAPGGDYVRYVGAIVRVNGVPAQTTLLFVRR
jgi:uncharacterized protein (TIGR03437 family)